MTRLADDPAWMARVRKRRASGWPYQRIADAVGVDVSTVYEALNPEAAAAYAARRRENAETKRRIHGRRTRAEYLEQHRIARLDAEAQRAKRTAQRREQRYRAAKAKRVLAVEPVEFIASDEDARDQERDSLAAIDRVRRLGA